MYPVIDKYQLPTFLKLLSQYKFPDGPSRHTAGLVWGYYHFSYHQMLGLDDTRHEFFKKENPTHDEIDFHLHKSWSHAYGMYALLRTTLEAMSTFRKMVGDTDPVGPSQQADVKRIIDIANDVVKHPMFKHNALSSGTQPVSLDISGNIDVVVTADSGDTEKKELDPMGDFYVVRNYLEYAAGRLV